MPRKLNAATNRKLKQNRRPNSDTSGAAAFGKNLSADHPPQPFAAHAAPTSTNSSTVRFLPSARARRKTRVESEHGDRDDQHRNRRAEHAENDQGEDQLRDREDDVDEARQQHIHPRPITAAVKPRVMPMKNDSKRRGGGDADRHARAIDQAGQHVAADLVGAEPAFAPTASPRCRRPIATGRRARATARTRRSSRSIATIASPIWAVRGARCPNMVMASLYRRRRRRGLTRIAKISASVFSVTKTAANTRPQAWITGTSRLETASTMYWPTPG